MAAAHVLVPEHHVPELPDGWWYAAKRRLLGPPLVTEQLSSQRLSKPLVLGVLSCDGLSSAAYGTEEILYALLPFFGLAAFTLVLPLTMLELTALFYGRTHITGVEPGRRIRLQGMVGIGDDGHPAMVNPACELLG